MGLGGVANETFLGSKPDITWSYPISKIICENLPRQLLPISRHGIEVTNLNTAALEDGNTAVRGPEIDTNDSAVILVRFGGCKKGWKDEEGGDECKRPEECFYHIELLHSGGLERDVCVCMCVWDVNGGKKRRRKWAGVCCLFIALCQRARERRKDDTR